MFAQRLLFRQFASRAFKPQRGGFSSHWKIYLATFTVGGLTAQYFPVVSILEYYLNSKLPEENDLEGNRKYAAHLEKKLQSLSLVKQLSSNNEFDQYRDWSYIQESKELSELETKKKRAQQTNSEKDESKDVSAASITEDLLTVAGGFSIKPLIFNNKKTNETVLIIYVGSKLCGYPFIVHGGILATVLDEVFKKTVGLKLNTTSQSTYVLSTSHLDISYRFPTIANNFIAIKSKTVDENNGYRVNGTIETLDGKLLIKGAAVVQADKLEHESGSGIKDGVKRGLKKVWPF